jgi:hypothetical protein
MSLDLYRIKLLVGNRGMAGAPLLHVEALVDAPTGRISGHGEITQAIAPPDDDLKINDLTGQVRTLGIIGPGIRVAALCGTYVYYLPGPKPAQITEKFEATLRLEQEGWNGQGDFTYGGREVDNVPVVSEDSGS